jgi:hypothetical protein
MNDTLMEPLQQVYKSDIHQSAMKLLQLEVYTFSHSISKPSIYADLNPERLMYSFKTSCVIRLSLKYSRL